MTRPGSTELNVLRRGYQVSAAVLKAAGHLAVAFLGTACPPCTTATPK